MRCLFCGSIDSKVIDSRPSEDGEAIRRRRECNNCGRRFTTYETIEMTPIYVIKRNGNRQQFDAEKIRAGILSACANRPISMAEVDKLVKNIEKQLYNKLLEEISSQEIGEMVMDGLKQIDEVAYIRFASVYRKFKDSETFIEEMQKFLKEKGLPTENLNNIDNAKNDDTIIANAIIDNSNIDNAKVKNADDKNIYTNENSDSVKGDKEDK